MSGMGVTVRARPGSVRVRGESGGGSGHAGGLRTASAAIGGATRIGFREVELNPLWGQVPEGQVETEDDCLERGIHGEELSGMPIGPGVELIVAEGVVKLDGSAEADGTSHETLGVMGRATR